jgi:hypothetical protein
MIRFKSSGVRLNFSSEPIRRLLRTLGTLDALHARASRSLYDGDIVVTSGNDSTHGAGSRHYTDEAIDVRTHNFTSRQAKRDFRQRWEEALGPQFRVLLEGEGTPNEHFHAQVRKGHVYRPEGF